MKGIVSLFAENFILQGCTMLPCASSGICAMGNNTLVKRLGENSDFRRERINDKVSKPI